MTGCLMFENLTQSEKAQIIGIIESNGGEFLNIECTPGVIEFNYKSEYPIRPSIVRDLISNGIISKLC